MSTNSTAREGLWFVACAVLLAVLYVPIYRFSNGTMQPPTATSLMRGAFSLYVLVCAGRLIISQNRRVPTAK